MVYQGIDSLSEEEQIEKVKNSEKNNAILYIDNPSEKVKLAAVKHNGDAIKYISNPSDELKMEAVKENGYSIVFINNPSEELKIEAVKQNGMVICYIKNPSADVQYYALKQEKNSLSFIPKENQSSSAIERIIKECDYFDGYFLNNIYALISDESMELLKLKLRMRGYDVC